MNKKLEVIRERDLATCETGEDYDVATPAEQDRCDLLSLVDTQAERIWGLQVALENADKAIDGVMELKKQIEKGRELLVNLTLEIVGVNPGQVIVNECVECGNIIDEWNKGHKEGCKVGAWLEEVAD